MNLKEYLFYKQLSLKDFASMIDISPSHLSSVLTGSRITTPKMIRTIAKATNGKVTADTMFAPTKLPDDWEDDADLGGKAAKYG